MKKINKLLAAVAVFASAFTLICSSIVTEAKPIDPYTYTVRIISGGDANFIGTDGITIDDSSAKVDIASDKKMLTISNLTVGTRISFNASEFIECEAGSLYNVAGIKEAGTDNPIAYCIVDQDVDYVVDYSLADLVEYTVKYVDEKDGKEIADAETFRGPVDTKIAVPHKYIDKYMPDAYSKRVTLDADATKNVITFKYKYGYVSPDGGRTYVYGSGSTKERTVGTSETTTINEPGSTEYVRVPGNNAGGNAAGNDGAGNGGAGNDGAGNAGAGNADGNGANAGNGNGNEAIDDGDVAKDGPEEVIDIDDEKVARFGDSVKENLIYIIAFGIIVLAMAAIIIAVAKNKKAATVNSSSQSENPSEDEK